MRRTHFSVNHFSFLGEVIQSSLTISLQVHRSEGRGWGLKSSDAIKKGDFVVEYVGEMITMAEYRRRMAANQAEKEENYYYLAIDSNRMIDAGPKGNVARFMNHSCAPNCITQKWTVNGDIRVGLFAVDDIKPGEELTFNYQFETVGDVQKKCLCGAPSCTGNLGGKQKKEDKPSISGEKVKKKKKKLKKRKQVVKKMERVWEEVCFRCTESGNLLKCEVDHFCPKVIFPKVFPLACDDVTFLGISSSLRKPGQGPIISVDLPLAQLCRLQQVCRFFEALEVCDHTNFHQACD